MKVFAGVGRRRRQGADVPRLGPAASAMPTLVEDSRLGAAGLR